MISVTLPRSHAECAIVIGCDRLVDNIYNGRADRLGYNSFDSHIKGILAETAFGFHYELDLRQVRNSKHGQPDFVVDNHDRLMSGEYDVKFVGKPNAPMRIKPSAYHDTWMYVKVTGELPTFTIVGWQVGFEIEPPGWWGYTREIHDDKLRQPR